MIDSQKEIRIQEEAVKLIDEKMKTLTGEDVKEATLKIDDSYWDAIALAFTEHNLSRAGSLHWTAVENYFWAQAMDKAGRLEE